MPVNQQDFQRNLSADTTRKYSPAIWHDCPVDSILSDRSQAAYHEDDFLNFSDLSIDAQAADHPHSHGYGSYIDTGVTFTQLPLAGGVLEIAGNDADNDEGILTTGGNTGTLAVLSDVSSTRSGPLWFECRIKKASIADNALAFFVGLSEEGLAAANTLIDDTGEIASKDMIGFRVLHDNGEELDFVYRKAGQAVQEIANISTLVADTYIKLGFKFDPRQPIESRIRIFVNNVEYTTKITHANMIAATFPDAEELALLLSTKVGAAAESKFQIDWWRVAQMY